MPAWRASTASWVCMAGTDDKSEKPDLGEIRERINSIDERIQALINDRAKIAQLVGVAKGDLAAAVDYYRPEREAEVLRGVLERTRGDFNTAVRQERLLKEWYTYRDNCQRLHMLEMLEEEGLQFPGREYPESMDPVQAP